MCKQSRALLGLLIALFCVAVTSIVVSGLGWWSEKAIAKVRRQRYEGVLVYQHGHAQLQEEEKTPVEV